MPEPTTDHVTHLSPFRHARNLLFIFLIAAVLALHALFIRTYPLNASGDGGAYIEMMARRTSDLIHASGYPFLMGLPLEWAGWSYHAPGAMPMLFNPQGIMTSPDSRAIIWMQHALAILTTLVGAYLTARRFGTAAGAIFLAAYGLDIYLIDDASASRPEWFQALLLVLTLMLVDAAWRAKRTGARIACYLSAAFVFAGCYIAKPVSIGLAGLVLLPPLLDKHARAIRFRLLAGMLLVGVGAVYSYLLLIHRPSTGTMDYSYTIGWVASDTARAFTPGGKLVPETGINSARFFALYQEIAAREGTPKIKTHQFRKHTDAVDPEIRRPYRAMAASMWTLSHEELLARIRQRPIPTDPSAMRISLYYFWGLKETNDLGVAIYRETALQHPLLYLEFLVKGLTANLLRDQTYPQCALLTTWRHPDPVGQYHVDLDAVPHESLGRGFIRADFGQGIAKDYGVNRFWLPGMRFLSEWAALRPPPWVKTLLFFGTAALAVASLWTGRGRSDRLILVLYLSLNALLFLVIAQAIAEARWNKEIRAIEPLLTGVVSVGLAWLAAAVWPARRNALSRKDELTNTDRHIAA